MSLANKLRKRRHTLLESWRRLQARGEDWRSPPASSRQYRCRRFAENPIIHPGMDASLGSNLMGPCLIRVPDWVARPLGRYYLYFSHHHGQHIRLAYADDLHGPWRIYPGGVLGLDGGDGCPRANLRVAAPDVHVDHDRRRFRMYFRNVVSSYLALSADGLAFQPGVEALAPPYVRVFEHDGWHYAIAKPDGPGGGGRLLRSRDGLSAFESGPDLLPRQRHVAVIKRAEGLEIFHTRIGDRPERILLSRMPLVGDWRTWAPGRPEEIARPEQAYEGMHAALCGSRQGAAHGPVRELRDPAVYEEDGRLYLAYACAGESALALAELQRLA